MKNNFRVVFTGKAWDQFGKRIVRSSLAATAFRCGYVVQDKVDHTTGILVASRTDTIKARRAAALGVTVLTYQEFIEGLVAAQS